MNTAIAKPVTDTPPSRPTTPVGPRIRPVSDGDDHGEERGGDHLVQSALGAQVDAGGVVGVNLVLHDAGDLAELTANLHHDGLGSLLHGAHRQGREHERQHRADEHANQNSTAWSG